MDDSWCLGYGRNKYVLLSHPCVPLHFVYITARTGEQECFRQIRDTEGCTNRDGAERSEASGVGHIGEILVTVPALNPTSTVDVSLNPPRAGIRTWMKGGDQ